jgi:hypothetical protein
MGRRRRRVRVSLLDDMDLDKMTDTGMWVWSGILTAVGLALSYGIALGWQRWKEKRKGNA